MFFNAQSLVHMNRTALVAHLKMASFELNLPTLVFGRPGVGKTEVIEQVYNTMHCGVQMEVVNITCGELSTGVIVGGIPVADHATRQTWSTEPEWYARCREVFESGNQPVLFLDELPNTPLDVTTTLLRLINDNRVGSYDLRKLCHKGFTAVPVIAAGNPPEDAAVYSMTNALANRFNTVYYDGPTPKEFVEYGAQSGKLHPLLIAMLDGTSSSAVTSPAEFMLSYPEDSFVASSPRALVKQVSPMLFYLDSVGNTDEATAISAMSTAIPRELAVQASAALRLMGALPRVADVFAQPSTVPVPEEPMMQLLQMRRIAAHVNASLSATALLHESTVPRDDVDVDPLDALAGASSGTSPEAVRKKLCKKMAKAVVTYLEREETLDEALAVGFQLMVNTYKTPKEFNAVVAAKLGARIVSTRFGARS